MNDTKQVPVEPTEEMLESNGWNTEQDFGKVFQTICKKYFPEDKHNVLRPIGVSDEYC